MRLKSSFLIIFAVICGCSSISKFEVTKLKDQYLESTKTFSTETPSKSVEQKCLQLIQLSKEKRFYIRDLAAIRAYLICPDIKKIEKLVNIDKIIVDDKPWLKEIFYEAQIRHYQQISNRTKESFYLIEKSKLLTQASQKVELLQKIRTDFADVLTSEQLTDINDRLQSIAPRFIVNPSTSDYVKVATDYRTIRDFKSAQNFYELVIGDPSQSVEQINHAYKGLRQSYKLQNNKKEFIRTTKKWNDWALAQAKINKWSTSSTEYYAESLIQLIRSLWTENQLSQAQYYLKKSFERLSHRYPMGDFIFIEARMAEEKQDFELARTVYAKMNQQSKLSPLQKNRALWGLAWNLRKLKKYSEAQVYFEELAANSQETSERFKYNFWLAKNKVDQSTLLEDSDTNKQTLLQEAAVHLADLKKQDHIGYYGLMAGFEITLTDKTPAVLNTQTTMTVADKDTKALNQNDVELKITEQERAYLNQLLSVEEFDIAKKYADYLTQNLKSKNLLSAKEWIYILQKYAQSKLYLPLFAAYNQLDEQNKNEIINSNVELLFPTDFYNLIKEASDKYNFSDEFILAIIRQESAFDPNARSPADAMGLMQLLPQVAEKISKTHSIPYERYEDLFKPEVNIPIGTLLLKQLLNKHGQQYIIAIASYNADESAVKGWIKTRYRGDILEFIEDIPYEETRGYVKLVLRNIMFYKKLLNPQNPSVQSIEKYLYIKNNS